jgi:hypothetical protein
MGEDSEEDIMKFIQQNTLPISYIIATTCIGYLIGYTDVGFITGVLTVCLANLIGIWVK